MTAIAGACWAWSEAFKAAGHDSFCCCPGGYDDGRTMPTDYPWPPAPDVLDRIHQADVRICYQGHPYRFPWYPKGKATLFVYVSQNSARYIWRNGEADGWPWAVDGEYQTRLYENATPVPECLPLGHEWFRPGPQPSDRVRIVYSPSRVRPDGDPWNDKGYTATVAALDGLSGPVEVDIITRRPWDECLARKRTAHIAIDECVTGAFHSNSLHGLAHGCVVVNNADDLCQENVRRVTGGAEAPFVRCGIDDLAKTLQCLVSMGPSRLALMGSHNRAWIEQHWQPDALIERNFMPLIREAMRHAALGGDGR